MSRVFAASTDRIVAPAPAVWPGEAGSIFITIGPNGWSSGTGSHHVFWSYGYEGSTIAVLDFHRFLDNKVYIGWRGDAAHGGDQRIVTADSAFFDSLDASHLYTWDSTASRYYVDGAERGARGGVLTPPALSGPLSNVTIGNYNAAVTNVNTRSTLSTFARWNRVLSSVEIAQLGRGAHPLDIGVGLVECIDLGSDTPERDLVSTVTYAVTGTTVVPDPVRLPSEIRRLAKRYEPILIFHPQEPFKPIDPKWYLERCALWPAAPPFTDKTKWGVATAGFPRAPRLSRGQIAAIAGEAAGDRRWIGAGSEFGVATVEALPADECFLDFAGWEPVAAPPSQVTDTSSNRYPAIDAASYTDALAGTRPWYYVEYLDYRQLGTLLGANATLSRLLIGNESLFEPRVLLYYFFYPKHDEALEGCSTEKGQRFGTYAGEWACVALLLDIHGTPRFIGLSSRNGGAPTLNGRGDRRIGVTALPWSAVETVSSGDRRHPKIFVSLGTHGHYTSGGTHPIVAFSPGFDITSGSCGENEGPVASLPGTVIPGQPAEMLDTGLAIAKGFSIIGLIWLGIEIADSNFGSDDTITPGVPDSTAPDTTGSVDFGVILRPEGIDFPEVAHASHVEDWKVNRYSADGRFYDCVVNRPSQLWWTPRRQSHLNFEGPGFTGRWGPRVTDDPFHRRAGGKCPDFLPLFLEGVAVAMNK